MCISLRPEWSLFEQEAEMSKCALFPPGFVLVTGIALLLTLKGHHLCDCLQSLISLPPEVQF